MEELIKVADENIDETLNKEKPKAKPKTKTKSKTKSKSKVGRPKKSEYEKKSLSRILKDDEKNDEVLNDRENYEMPTKGRPPKSPKTRFHKKETVGRKVIKIDQVQFEKLCAMQCTEVEICGFFGCGRDILNDFVREAYGEDKTFKDVFPILSSDGKISLRRIQFKLAEKSASMAIFLGKQYLGQKECPTTDTEEETLNKLKEIINNVKLDAKNISKEDIEDVEEEPIDKELMQETNEEEDIVMEE